MALAMEVVVAAVAGISFAGSTLLLRTPAPTEQSKELQETDHLEQLRQRHVAENKLRRWVRPDSQIRWSRGEFTKQWSILGIPNISVPCHIWHKTGPRFTLTTYPVSCRGS